MADEHADNPERAAILERRRRFIARSLPELDARPSSRGTKAIALALSGLATACPCLKMATDTEPPPEDEATSEPTEDSGDATGTGTEQPDEPTTGESTAS